MRDCADRTASCAKHWSRRSRETGRPVSRHNKKLSIVPNAISPAAARSRKPGTESSSQRIFEAEKYGSITRPVRGCDVIGQPGLAPGVAQTGGAPVLPDDRIMHDASRAPLPQHRGFALVGDADRGDRPASRGVDRLAAGRDDGLPDFLRVVFDPARSGIYLAQRDPGRVMDAASGVEQDRPRAGRPLVDRDQELHPAGITMQRPLPFSADRQYVRRVARLGFIRQSVLCRVNS